jgi:catechol 2,3-dioxygenase-like lactoylglutathione lyase family enzyme
VDGRLAAAWGAPAVAGRRCVLLSPDSAEDVYLRIVEGRTPADYVPLTTFGWNAIEIVVDDLDATWQRLQAPPFTVLGEPRGLARYPSIRAFQLLGPAGEVLYLTGESGDRSRSPLPPPGGPIGRVFIMVLAGPDIQALLAAYGAAFGLVPNAVGQRAVSVLQRAQGLGPDELLPLTTARLAEPGNLLEFDGYSERATPRRVAAGELSCGVAMTSIEAGDFDAVLERLAAPGSAFDALGGNPLRPTAPEYAGARAAVFRGPAGELLELIERGRAAA